MSSDYEKKIQLPHYKIKKDTSILLFVFASSLPSVLLLRRCSPNIQRFMSYSLSNIQIERLKLFIAEAYHSVVVTTYSDKQRCAKTPRCNLHI